MLKEGPPPTNVIADFWGGLEKHMLASPAKGTDHGTHTPNGKTPHFERFFKEFWESGSYSLTGTHANWEQERWATERVRHRFHSWPPLRHVTRLLAIRSVCFKGRFRDARGPFFKDDPSPKSLRDNSLNRKRWDLSGSFWQFVGVEFEGVGAAATNGPNQVLFVSGCWDRFSLAKLRECHELSLGTARFFFCAVAGNWTPTLWNVAVPFVEACCRWCLLCVCLVYVRI